MESLNGRSVTFQEVLNFGSETAFALKLESPPDVARLDGKTFQFTVQRVPVTT